ncbi:hypothetical protein [Polaribacter glomeratus]|uniref:Uncharacterized protein n=1 Tax=Polaribacter glomeratus TaxID=102 RepID=A0A2S7WV90_9FLAO|nr:hypothetical protein [Polaribacter glomeratus]PQJ81468.1 hypothetical protein BTO16_02250 [Polaribacter glomeratus]TXD64730.1 hypothetical protein ESX12_13000 [Polaribacter glomeratus]
MKKFLKQFFLILISVITITIITVYIIELVHELLICINHLYQMVVNEMLVGTNYVDKVILNMNLNKHAA